MGETLSEADIGEAGIPGDRSCAVRDEKRGGIRGGKKIPQLMTLTAHSGSTAPLITAPDGDSASASTEGIIANVPIIKFAYNYSRHQFSYC